MKDKAFKLLILGVVVLVSLFLLGFILPWLAKNQSRARVQAQREHQLKTVHERINANGGWEALHQECQSLFADHGIELYWRPPSTYKTISDALTNVSYGPLPPVLASLQPREVQTVSTDPPVIRIHVFGSHRTGIEVPFYYLYVISGPSPDNFTPAHQVYLTLRKVTNGIFEAY